MVRALFAFFFLLTCGFSGSFVCAQSLPAGFTLEKLYEVPKKRQGSWVSMTQDDRGRLIVSDQYGSLYRVSVPEKGKVSVERLPLKIGGAHGLLWHEGKLYASVSANVVVPLGVYVISDTNKDGELDHVELIKKLKGGGEHGPHGLVLSPDRKWIYIVCGNHTNIPRGILYYHASNKWGEDHLLPTQPDARGHARTRNAPGGWIARFTPDGKHWELVSQGFRNTYDIAFNQWGDLLAYDSDMEWDFGTPWYRPTRLMHATAGAEFGWRTGTGKWPSYYVDSRPAMLDIGPGSPTGLLSGAGAKFPTRYQAAVFAVDWTFATIYAIHLEPTGATYTAKKEEFLTAKGMPLNDAIIGADGSMYVLTGGRRTQSSLYRIVYRGKESIQQPVVEKPNALAQLRRKLEGLVATPDETHLDFIWNNLSHGDQVIRYTARVALEHLPTASWFSKLAETPNPFARHQLAVAVAHQGDKVQRERMLALLSEVDFSKLNKLERLEHLRAQALLIARSGHKISGQRRSMIIKQLDPHYPVGDEEVDRELCRMLCFLQCSRVVEKTLGLIASNKSREIPDWAQLAQRNDGYGKAIIEMLRNQPSIQNLHYVYCLRIVKGPWTEGQRRQYFEWFQMASQKSGGRSYKGFINNIRKEAMRHVTAEEKKMIEGWKLVDAYNPFENLPKIKGPGKSWKISDITAMADLKAADLKNGERMFRATLCAACHQVNGKGGGSGPDLSKAASRFQLRDFAEAIIEPNKVVSDQFEFSILSKTDGSFVTGKVLEEKDGFLIVATNPFDFSATVEVLEDDVKSVKPSPASPMPPALINGLNKEELRDLMGYLMSLK